MNSGSGNLRQKEKAVPVEPPAADFQTAVEAMALDVNCRIIKVEHFNRAAEQLVSYLLYSVQGSSGAILLHAVRN